MSSVQSEVKCKQCGFPEAWEVFECRSNEYTVDCFRCGYHESWKHESYFSNGHLEKGVQEVIYSAGAYCATKTDNGIEAHEGLSEADVEKIAAKMRDDIASGKLSPKSYVTRYNFDTHEVTALVGQVPSGDDTQEGAQLKKRVMWKENVRRLYERFATKDLVSLEQLERESPGDFIALGFCAAAGGKSRAVLISPTDSELAALVQASAAGDVEDQPHAAAARQVPDLPPGTLDELSQRINQMADTYEIEALLKSLFAGLAQSLLKRHPYAPSSTIDVHVSRKEDFLGFWLREAFGHLVDLSDLAIVKAMGTAVAHYVCVDVFKKALLELTIEEQTPQLLEPARMLQLTGSSRNISRSPRPMVCSGRMFALAIRSVWTSLATTSSLNLWTTLRSSRT